MANSGSTTGICLHALSAREEAVLRRVISFSSTQGRNYVLADAQAADMLVVSDDTVVDPALMNPAGCLLVRIADAGTAQRYDILMQRPLLVTKVMRTLDQAQAMLSATPAAARADAAPQPDTVQPVSPVQPVKPAPAPQPVEPVSPADTQAAPQTASAASAASTGADSAATQSIAAAPEKPTPKPAMSLYAQILGGGAKSAVAQQAESKPGGAPERPAVAAKAEATDAQSATDAQQQNEPASAQSAPSAVHATAPLEHEAAGVTGNAAPPPGMHHLALVVDDSAAIRKQLELELRAAGIAAEFAETGEEALEKVAANRYDLIFLDIIMPGIDGYEACRQMRLRPELKKTPIIMLSAKTSPLDEVQGVIAGASTYLTKPVKSDQLQQTLKRVSMWLDNFQASV